MVRARLSRCSSCSLRHRMRVVGGDGGRSLVVVVVVTGEERRALSISSCRALNSAAFQRSRTEAQVSGKRRTSRATRTLSAMVCE